MKAIEFGHDCCKKIAAGIRELAKLAGKTEARVHVAGYQRERCSRRFPTAVRAELSDALNTEKYGKLESYSRSIRPRQKAIALFTEETEQAEAGKVFDALKERIFRDEMLKDRRRPDGRAFDQIRPITCEVGVAAANSRFRYLHAWRNAGAGHHDTRHQRRRAAH